MYSILFYKCHQSIVSFDREKIDVSVSGLQGCNLQNSALLKTITDIEQNRVEIFLGILKSQGNLVSVKFTFKKLSDCIMISILDPYRYLKEQSQNSYFFWIYFRFRHIFKLSMFMT